MRTNSVGSRPLEDRELIERARGGDVGAYEALVRRYQDVAVRAAYVVTGPDEAEDAAQEAFVKAYRALARFQPDAPFRPWLLQIVTNEARNRRRASGRRVALALRAAADDPGDAAPSPESAALEDEAHRRLVKTLNDMAERDRELIACRYFLELTEPEIAQALGIPRGTVKSRLSRAMARLRQRMGAEDG
ncbi:MAG TPA: sigma-70 family RNA polymerase sigma factor [Actinomycetota bacterium]|nr:sigma-70 family RNA polymerase sigma factor [Actinomycetota bacterium]